jgi:hypothetical protein
MSGELRALDGVSDVTAVLVPGGASAVTVTSDRPLARQAVADALGEAGDYKLAGGAEHAAGRPCRRQVKPRAGRGIRSVRPEDLFPNGPWCT